MPSRATIPKRLLKCHPPSRGMGCDIALEGTLGMTPSAGDGALSRDHAHIVPSEAGAAVIWTHAEEYDPTPN